MRCKIKSLFLNCVYINNIHRPLGNFNSFLQSLDNVLQLLYTSAFHIIICGDININCLVENEQKSNLIIYYLCRRVVPKVTVLIFYLIIHWTHLILQIICFKV